MRTLRSINDQSQLPDEVIVVSGEEFQPLPELLQNIFPSIQIQVINTEPSVCLQRNTGIKAAKGKYIFLCDDDIELEPAYIQKLTGFLDNNLQFNIASGLFLEKLNGDWIYEFKVKSDLNLFYKFIFFHSIWSSLDHIKRTIIPVFLLNGILKHYRQKGNTITKAGWPLLTSFDDEITPTMIYSLGAAIIRRSNANEIYFDEVLDRSGIGENYGVLYNRDNIKSMAILKSARAKHHKEQINRLNTPVSYFRRVMAMDYFIRLKGRKNITNHFCLIWSIFGNLIPQVLNCRFDMALASLRIIISLVMNINPYLRFKKKNLKFCEP